MNPLYRGFAGLLAVFVLAFYVAKSEKSAEREKALIAGDPVVAAAEAFGKSEFIFYECWLHRLDEKGNEIGYWILPGEKEISPNILERYRMRKRLEQTDGIQISLERERYNRKA